MKVSLLLSELKVFTRAISALGKLGYELYFECGPGETCCKVFKQTLAWDKVMQRCKLQLDEEHNLFVVQFFQRHGIVKTYNLPIIECESLEAVYSISDSDNRLSVSSKIIGEIMSNFRPNQTEITMDLQEGECVFRNYIEDSDFSTIVTHVPVSSSEFDAYDLREETNLTFCQKDMRAAISFGEAVHALVTVNCSQPGQPIVLTFTDDSRFKATFVLATLPCGQAVKRTLVDSTVNVSTAAGSSSAMAASFAPRNDSRAPSAAVASHADLRRVPPSLGLVGSRVPGNAAILSASRDPSRAAPGTTDATVTASTPLSVGCPPPPKKARCALFSRLGGDNKTDSFFQNPPPAQIAAPIAEDIFTEETPLDESFSMFHTDWLPDPPTNQLMMGQQPPANQLTTAGARAVATAGWSVIDEIAGIGRKSDAPTLLVADSDEEE